MGEDHGIHIVGRGGLRASIPVNPQLCLGVNGRWLTEAEAGADGFVLVGDQRRFGHRREFRLSVRNQSGRSCRLDGLRWDFPAFAVMSPADVRVYLEGWTMATPCGCRRFGETDFSFNPDYLRYAVCLPETHDVRPNHFRAEHMVAVQDFSAGLTRLAGFLTGGDQFGCFTVVVGPDGQVSVSAISSCDGRECAVEETVSSECLTLMEGTCHESLFAEFARLWGAAMHARTRFGRVPVGWCSWYYYFERVTERDVMENVEYLAGHRDAFPVEYIQLDDGYQSACGDWLTCRDTFPSGLAGLARRIREHGFKPALWLGIFMVEENSRLLAEHPEWMIHDREGSVLYAPGFAWRGHRIAVLDGTHPGTQRHFRSLFRRLRELGFDYVKLDFLMFSACLREGVLHDRKATRAQALRRGLTAIREGFGEDGFILGCTAPLGPVVGLVDGERIATDITPYWVPDKYSDESPTVPNVCRNVINRGYLHRRLWLNDPDVLMVRSDQTRLSGDEARLWYDVLRLTGGLLMLGDRLSTLGPERAAWVRELLAAPDGYAAVPRDRFSRTCPSMVEARSRRGGAHRLGYFNFSSEASVLGDELVPPHASVVKDAEGGALIPEEDMKEGRAWEDACPARRRRQRLPDMRQSLAMIHKAHFQVTGRCNLACPFCGQHKGMLASQGDMVSYERWQDLALEVADLAREANRRPEIMLWGGEPLLYDRFDDLAEWLHARGFVLGMVTNGTLIDRHADVINRCIDQIHVSVDGYGASHDAVRGEGVFARVRGNLSQLRARRGRLIFLTTISEHILERLPDLPDELSALGPDEIVLQPLMYLSSAEISSYRSYSQEWFGQDYPELAAWLRDDDRSYVRALSVALGAVSRRRYPIPVRSMPLCYPDHLGAPCCEAPFRRVHIRNDGELGFCTDYFGFSAGNIRDHCIRELVSNERSRLFRQAVMSHALSICDHCPWRLQHL